MLIKYSYHRYGLQKNSALPRCKELSHALFYATKVFDEKTPLVLPLNAEQVASLINA